MALIEVSHLQAETYPYKPGMTSRAGKPCWLGSGSPFMPTAIIASLPSNASARETLEVNPSLDLHNSWSAAGSMFASERNAFNGTPSQRALPAY